MVTALETDHRNIEWFGHTDHGELSFCANNFVTDENQFVRFESHGRKLLHIEQVHIGQMFRPGIPTRIERVGVDREIDAARFGREVDHDFTASLIEMSV
jgi:hypothetical protein